MPRFNPQRLREEINRRSLSNAEAAERADVNAATLYQALAGRNVHPKTYRKITEMLAQTPVIDALRELSDLGDHSQEPDAVTCAIIRDGLYLMVHRRAQDGGLEWAGPSGSIEAGETPENAAVRVADEKVGIVVAAIERLGGEGRVHPATGVRLFYVACRVADGEPAVVDTDSIDAVEWCDLETVKDRWGKVRGGVYRPLLRYLEAEMRRP